MPFSLQGPPPLESVDQPLDWTQLVVGYWIYEHATESGLHVNHHGLGAELGISATRVTTALRRLVAMGALTRTGGPRSSRYRIAQPTVRYRKSAGNAVVEMDLADRRLAQSNLIEFKRSTAHAKVSRTSKVVTSRAPSG